MRWDKKKKVLYKIRKPACILEYNDGMGVVDRHDQYHVSLLGKKKYFYFLT